MSVKAAQGYNCCAGNKVSILSIGFKEPRVLQFQFNGIRQFNNSARRYSKLLGGSTNTQEKAIFGIES